MIRFFAKLRIPGKANKYRKILETDQEVYPPCNELIKMSIDYSPDTLLESDVWYKISDFSNKEYSIDIITNTFDSVKADTFKSEEFEKIDFLFALDDDTIYFQNIGKGKLVHRNKILWFGEEFKYQAKTTDIAINEIPDAVYTKTTDTLYFRNLSSITGIFIGINQLYREATEEETDAFLNEDFICLENGFSAEKVNINNRKSIALATDILKKLDKNDKDHIFSYIGEYCPGLKVSGNTFRVGSEEQLKLLLFGIEQRFYTTPVGKEQRIANSVVPLNST